MHRVTESLNSLSIERGLELHALDFGLLVLALEMLEEFGISDACCGLFTQR